MILSIEDYKNIFDVNSILLPPIGSACYFAETNSEGSGIQNLIKAVESEDRLYFGKLTSIKVDIDSYGVHHNLFAKDQGMASHEIVYVPKGFKIDDDMLFNESKEATVSRILENIEDWLDKNKRSSFYREWKGLSNWQKVQKIIMRNTSVAGSTASTKYCCHLGLAPDRYSVYNKLEITEHLLHDK